MRILIVGTGTDVGKTHVTCALARSFREAGTPVVAWKPIASGVDGTTPGDAEAISEAAGTPVIAPSYSFVPPVSPHLAARQAGITIDIEVLAKRAEELGRGTEVLLVETAGGLFSPVAPDVFNADLVRRLSPCRVLLIAPDRIGVLHDVQATVLAGRSQGVTIDVVALSAVERPDASSGTNAGEIATMLGIEVAAVFPRAASNETGTRAASERLRASLALSLFLAPLRPYL